MSDTISPAADAKLARQLVDSDLLSRVFAEYGTAIVERWVDAASLDEREDAHAKYSALEELKERIESELAKLATE